MKISAIPSYIETLQFTCDVIFDDSINNVNDLNNGLGNAIDKINALDICLLMEESILPEAGTKWIKLMEINQMKCERLNKIPFSEPTLEKFKDRVNVIYERFPLIQRIDNMSEGAYSLYTDFELAKLLLESNVDSSKLTFTKCKDVVEMFMDKQIEFLNLYSEIEQHSNIQSQMQIEQQSYEAEEILSRPEIQAIFSKAISKGLMDAKGNWFESASLLAIFCQRIFFKHLIKRYPDLNPDGTPKKEWKPFQDYFRVNGKLIDFRDAFKRAKKNIPRKLFLIDDIIEETPQAQQDRLKDHS